MPNNRELALIVFAIAGLLWCLTQREMRSHLGAMWRAAFPALVAYAFGLAVWTGLVVWAGSHVDWWDASLTSSTVLWFLTAGVVFLGALREVGQQPHWFRQKASAALGVAVILEGITSVFVFPLVIEACLFVALLVLGGLTALPSIDQRYQQVRQSAEGMIAVLVLAMLVRSLIGVISAIGDDEGEAALRQAALAVCG